MKVEAVYEVSMENDRKPQLLITNNDIAPMFVDE